MIILAGLDIVLMVEQHELKSKKKTLLWPRLSGRSSPTRINGRAQCCLQRTTVNRIHCVLRCGRTTAGCRKPVWWRARCIWTAEPSLKITSRERRDGSDRPLCRKTSERVRGNARFMHLKCSVVSVVSLSLLRLQFGKKGELSLRKHWGMLGKVGRSQMNWCQRDK